MISGVETHVLSDTGATHRFVSPGLIGKGLFQMGTWDCLVRDILVLITDRVMPADLIVDHRQGNACGSDCSPP